MKIHLCWTLVGLWLLLGTVQAKPREQRKSSSSGSSSRAHEMTNRMGGRGDHTGRHHDRQVVHHTDQLGAVEQKRRSKWSKRAEEKNLEPQQDVLLREEHFLQVTPRNPSQASAHSSEGRISEGISQPTVRRSVKQEEEEKTAMHRGSSIKGKVLSAAKRKGARVEKKGNKKAGAQRKKKRNENSKVFEKAEGKPKSDSKNRKKDGNRKKANKHMWKKAARKAMRNHRGEKRKDGERFEKVVSKKMKKAKKE